MIQRIKKLSARQGIIFILIFAAGIAFGYGFFTKNNPVPAPELEKNTTQVFISEIYDKIKENYWDNISDAQLLDLFKSSIEKNGGQIKVAKFDSKEKMLESLSSSLKNIPDDQKNKFTLSLASTVLSSLNPIGRSGLFTTKQEKELKNKVENINPEKDLYKDLGIAKGASEQAVTEAYQKKSDLLKTDKSASAQAELAEIAYAKEVLTQKEKKELYDQKGVEPTIFSKLISSQVLYIQFKKFSPTSYDEFTRAFDAYKDNATVASLIFDLRGNIGGTIDATSYYLGNFIGKNQYAFDFYHKGEYLPFKTPTEKLPSIAKYKQVVILVDENTQSSAEMMAGALKKYHIGVVIGSKTKGWGTVERVFQLDNQFDTTQKYSMFLVHSITLRDDNQPIEGRGVEPDINIKTLNWEQQLNSYFRNSELIQAVESVIPGV